MSPLTFLATLLALTAVLAVNGMPNKPIHPRHGHGRYSFGHIMSDKLDIPMLDDPRAYPDSAPERFDWRKAQPGVVSPVKNQGLCGSCWAFSVTGNVEGVWNVRHKKAVSLSEQELLDCFHSLPDPCQGDNPGDVLKKLTKSRGLASEKQYPYEGRGHKCLLQSKPIVARINGSVQLTKDEDKIAAYLAKNGPVSVALNADLLTFYDGSILNPSSEECDPNDRNHAVLLVGYDVDPKTGPYWIVKNSWGEDWGDKGYFYLHRGSNACGVSEEVVTALVR